MRLRNRPRVFREICLWQPRLRFGRVGVMSRCYTNLIGGQMLNLARVDDSGAISRLLAGNLGKVIWTQIGSSEK